MTCKGPYCERSADCKDINCPGHPGQHCQHLKENKREEKTNRSWILRLWKRTTGARNEKS